MTTARALSLFAGVSVLGTIACGDDDVDPLEVPSRPGERSCALTLEAPEPDIDPDGRIITALFDGPRSGGLWMVVDPDGSGGAPAEIRRRPANAAESPIAARPVEGGSVAARYRFVEGSSPGSAWLDRDRLDVGPDQQLQQFAFDLWRLDASDREVPIFYKPQVNQAANLPGDVSNYNYRTVVLDGSPFLLAVPNESTAAEFKTFCGGVRDPAITDPPQGVYFCFFPLSPAELTLGTVLEAGPLPAASGFRFSRFDLEPISNLRSTGVAMVPMVREVYPINPSPLTDFIRTELVVVKLRALGDAPVLPSVLLVAVMGSDELGPTMFDEVRPVQDELFTYFNLDDLNDGRDTRVSWTDVLAFDSFPQAVVEDLVPPGAVPVQLADGAAFGWLEGGQFWLREMQATGARDPGEDELRLGPVQRVFDDFALESFSGAGPGHLVLQDTNGGDHLARLDCK